MATLSVQDTALDGTDVTLAAADGSGDDFPNTGNEYLEVSNGSGGEITVTCSASGDCNQGFTHDSTTTIPDGESRRIGRFPTARFGDSVSVSYSTATSVTVAAVKV